MLVAFPNAALQPFKSLLDTDLPRHGGANRTPENFLDLGIVTKLRRN